MQTDKDFDPSYASDARQRLRAFSEAMGVQHQNAPFRSQRLCGKFPRSSPDPRYPNGEIPIRIRLGRDGYRHPSFGNLVGCGNVWICPRCSEAKSHLRRQQINASVDSWLAEGLPLWFLTLTIPHTPADSLATLLEAKQKAWRAVTNDRSFRLIRASGALSGYIAVTQVKFRRTPRWNSGWHVHMHVLLFMAEPLSGAQMESFKVSASDAWGRALRTHVAAPLSQEHGAHLEPIEDNFGLGHYLSTIERYSPGNNLEGLAKAASRTQKRLALDDVGSKLPMELFDEFAQRRTGKDAPPGGRFFQLPAGGNVWFDAGSYWVSDTDGGVERLRISKRDHAWFEFQLAIRKKRKTVFSNFGRAVTTPADEHWEKLRRDRSTVDDSTILDDSYFAEGAGLDTYLVDQRSWRRSLANNANNRTSLLLAAGRGDAEFFKVAELLGVRASAA